MQEFEPHQAEHLLSLADDDKTQLAVLNHRKIHLLIAWQTNSSLRLLSLILLPRRAANQINPGTRLYLSTHDSIGAFFKLESSSSLRDSSNDHPNSR